MRQNVYIRAAVLTRVSSPSHGPGLSGQRIVWSLSGHVPVCHTIASAWMINVEACEAFSNALPEAVKYADRPKRRGPTPKGLGLKLRSDVNSNTPELNLCGGAPNCFSTTPDEVSPEHMIEPWSAPSTVSKMQAWEAVRAAISGYPPGQQGIDGGGFRVVTDDGGYLYAQFESLKNGYIDDLELALSNEAPYRLRVRSSSRVGYLGECPPYSCCHCTVPELADLGVNAKRLNAIAANLRAAGWKAPEITPQTHPSYFAQNAPPKEQVPPSTAFRR